MRLIPFPLTAEAKVVYIKATRTCEIPQKPSIAARNEVIKHHVWSIEPVVIYDIATDYKRTLGYRCGAFCVSPATVFEAWGPAERKRVHYRWAVMFRGRILLWLWKFSP